MNKYYSKIVKYFNYQVSQGVKEDESSCSVGAWLRTQYGTFQMVVQSFGEDGNHVLFSVRNVMSVPKNETSKALMLMSLINCETFIGNFAIDEEDRELSFRIPFCLCDSDLSSEQFSHGFNLAMSMVVQYYPAFQKLFWSDLSPAEALKSLRSNEGSEHDSSLSGDSNIPENYADVAIEEFIGLLKENPSSSKDKYKTQD